MDYKQLLKKAYTLSCTSPDPSTQNGALLVDSEGVPFSFGVNEFPKMVEYTAERWERPLKYKVIEHAERNAIYSAARRGQITNGSTMICGWAACSDCARAIIQAGLVRLVTHKQAHERSPQFWQDEINVAFKMLEEAGVEVVMYDGEIGTDFDLKHSGQIWRP